MTTPYDATVLADSPASYWTLADPSGTAAADSAGSNTGTYAGGVTLNTVGPSATTGNCAAFNGSTGKATVPNAASLQLSGDFSLECWVRTTRSGTFDFFFGKYPSGTTFGYGLAMDGPTGQAMMWVGDTAGSWLNSTRVVNDGLWHHVVGTRSGTSLVIYVDAVPTAGTRTPSLANTDPLRIGVDAFNQFFLGSLSGVAVYNAVLSQAAVAAHYRMLSGIFAARAHAGLPGRPALSAPWKANLLFAVVPGREAGAAAGARDHVSGQLLPFATSGVPMPRAAGPWGPELSNTHTGSQGVGVGRSLQGLTEFTLASLCRCDALADLSHLWGGENTTTADMRFSLLGTAGALSFQLGADGAWPLLSTVMPVGEYVLVTARLAPGGVRSIWLGPYKAAERADPGIAYGSGLETNGTGWGGSPQIVNRAWAGRLVCGYGWARALSDSEVVALAADPFAPVRRRPPRLGVLAPAAGLAAADPPPWLRGAAAAPRAARLPPPPAFGWAPRLAEAADLLPWLRRAAAQAPAPLPAPRAPLAPWTPASAPAPDPLAWLFRPAPAPAPGARPPAVPQAGWRLQLGGVVPPPVRHALVRFWRGPEARMPRLEDGEPAWATDTKSLWIGSATGNVRIGP